ncbi:MAG: zinc ribbon domain-containing protein [Eggerthellaceae bacterium]|nr:zinc ribbon domain-containing protein [Eggerthellaceae bacterium]
MICPNCGFNQADGKKFCENCGSSLGVQAAQGMQPPMAQQPMPAQQPQQLQQPQPAPGAPAPAAAGQRRGVAVPLAIAGGAALLVVVAVVAVGLLTNWFGLANGEYYAVSKLTTFDENGNKVAVTEYDRDENGLAKTYKSTNYTSNGEVQFTTLYTVKYDENGYVKKSFYTSTAKNGDKLSEYSAKQDFEKDRDGKPVKTEYENERKASSGADITKNKGTTTMEYHPNGHLKSSLSESTNTGSYGSGSTEYTSENTSLSEYDDRGYVLHTEWTDSNYQGKGSKANGSTEYAWEFDSAGKPTSMKETGAATVGENYEKSYTFDTDEAGNITAVYDEKGNKVKEYEYVRVERPLANIKFSQTRTY